MCSNLYYNVYKIFVQSPLKVFVTITHRLTENPIGGKFNGAIQNVVSQAEINYK